MFLLICATLLLSVKGGDTGKATTTPEIPGCQGGACISLGQTNLTAEAGLCVLLLCSFTTNDSFTPESLTWEKCSMSEPNCTDPKMILPADNNITGNASRLQSDLNKGNCSILINDLSESDSGFYRVRVEGRLSGEAGRYMLSGGASVHVKDLSQRPTVTVPPLSDGQQATLTCTAPGLCSASPPNITWMWKGGGASDAHIAGSSEAESVSGATVHSSALTFNSSAEHHGRSLTCRVTFRGGATTEETVTLSVTYAKKLEINGNTSVEEGDALNVTCSIESNPPFQIRWTKVGESDGSLQNGTGAANLLVVNVTEEHSGLYVCTATHLDKNLKKSINLTVKHLTAENMTTKPSDDLNLTCSSENLPLFLNTWAMKNKLPQTGSARATVVIPNVATKDSGFYICSSKHLDNLTADVAVTDTNWTKTTGEGKNADVPCRAEGSSPYDVTWSGSRRNTDVQSTMGKATLAIPDMRAGSRGPYVCKAQHRDTSLTLSVDVSMTFHPKVLQDGSECASQSGVLTCVCISWGFPLPTIRWLLLKNHTEYSVITTVSNYTVNSTATMTLKNSGSIVRCVSSNENGQVEVDIHVKEKKEHNDTKMRFLRSIMQLEIIVAFFIGTLFSILLVVFCCCVKRLHRKKKKRSDYGPLEHSMEMLPTQEAPLIHTGEAARNNQSQDQEAAAGGGVEAAGKSDVEYSSVSFSLLEQKASTKAARSQESSETEYAEIKKEKEGRNGEGGVEEEELVIIDEEGETDQTEADENEENLYSNLNDVMEQF